MTAELMEKEIIVTETIGVARVGEPVRVGIPFTRGELADAGALCVRTPGEVELPVQVATLNRWHDGSIKWLLVDFAATVAPLGRASYRLGAKGEGSHDAASAPRVTPGAEAWQVDTGVALFCVDARVLRPFARVERADGAILSGAGEFTLVTDDGQRLLPRVESITVEAEGPLRVVLTVRGRFATGDRETFRFCARLHFCAGSSCVQLDFALHNPFPARHGGGLWDLGDPGSLLFRALTLHCPAPGGVTAIECGAEPGSAPIRLQASEGGLALHQESSGGENWLSPVHRTREGRVPFTARGYRLRSGDRELATGLRATPLIWCGGGATGMAAVLPRFWQEFPKAVAADAGGLKISLFPDGYPELHELQGGERKTHTLYLDFAAQPGELAWARAPLTAAPAADVVRRAGVIADLPLAGGEPGELKPLVERFISGPEEFLRKREALDEYGWRNFGELPADHEGVYHQGAEPFVSHYNNQYDPCAGMYRAWLCSGEPLWGELASDLARHVLDIDLYHTDADREEYNHGLFWHTDHYVAAGLATHRSFSREQIGTRDPRYCGGGPGAEHCYTTGLTLHHLLTGDPEARQAVLSLADWCYRSLSGAPTLLAALKNTRRNLVLLRGTDPGKPEVFPRFPLSRGTGNAVNACLDAYELSADAAYLDRAEELIRGALHPDDDIEARNLRDAEGMWSYTVLLSAVTKYLATCEELEGLHRGYGYARACLLAYAGWMCRHEYPYLDKPEILEYPNETWPAQDLRKSVVLYRAARYLEPAQRDLFLDRARSLYASARDELARHHTSAFTRPVALMLQNGWVGARLETGAPLESAPPLSEERFAGRIPFLCRSAVVSRMMCDLARALRETSLQRELAWLKARL